MNTRQNLIIGLEIGFGGTDILICESSESAHNAQDAQNTPSDLTDKDVCATKSSFLLYTKFSTLQMQLASPRNQ